MDSDYQNLVSLFSSNPKSAIETSQKIISSVSNFDSYKDFYQFHLQNAHISTCTNEWASDQLCVYCRDCAASHPACVCLQCFLNGNHKGHNYVILKTSGNCDCGDLSQWKREGCCPKHRGLPEDDNHPEDYLDEKLRTILTDVIFKAAFSALKNFSETKSPNISMILDFISSFLKFGDGFRRLIAQALTEKIDFEEILLHIPDYSMFFNQSLQQLCGGLVNDQLFIRNFSLKCYSAISNSIIKETSNYIIQGEINCSYNAWNRFFFHSFSEKVLKYNILQCNWDWVSFYTECLPYYKDLFDFIKYENYEDATPILSTIGIHLSSVTNLQPNEQTQLLFDNIVTKILTCGSIKSISSGLKDNNTIIVTSFNEESTKEDYYPFVEFILRITEVFKAFKNKPNLKFDKLIEELDKSLDISALYMIGRNSIGNGNGSENENDKFITRFFNQKDASYPSTYYKSFHNGGSILLSHPLLFSLASFFRNDNISRVKLSRILSMDKYQNLRFRICIACMKAILSSICRCGLLVSEKNYGTVIAYILLIQPDYSSNYFTKIFPLFQMLIGLHFPSDTITDEFCLKEFFAFEAAREIGLFDDFSSIDYKDENISEKQKQMHFSFLYFSLLLVLDRTLFNYIGNDFICEQLIFQLKNGEHSIEKLEESYDKSAIDSWSNLWIFNYILNKVATTNNNQNSAKSYDSEASFYLKDDVEWKPISLVNPLNGQMTLMNNEISKDSSNLLKINKFEPEEEYFYHPRKLCKDEVLNESSIEDEDCDSTDLHIQLKNFLYTPTVLAVVYNTLRTSSGPDSPNSDLNDHLAMNILVLISKFMKEIKDEDEYENGNLASLDEYTTVIQCESLVDLISKLKKSVFNYHFDKDGSAIIENKLNKKTFVSLLKLKIGSQNLNLQPKSIIEVLLQKGKLGRNVLDEISLNVDLGSLQSRDKNGDAENGSKEIIDMKEIKHQKAKQMKEQIMNHFKTIISNFNAHSDHFQSKENEMIEDGVNKEGTTTSLSCSCCSICSTHKKDEILTFPIYIYRTKFPFIIDKPPKIDTDDEKVDEDEMMIVDDNFEDFDHDLIESHEDEHDEEEDGKEIAISSDDVMATIFENFPQLIETEGLSEEDAEEREKTLQIIFNTLINQKIQMFRFNEQMKNSIGKIKKIQSKELKEHRELKEKTPKSCKYSTFGVNFILQFGICQHNVHPSCVKDGLFTCPIDRSIKNALLPCLDGIDPSIILNEKEDDMLSKSVLDSIEIFLVKFTYFFKCTNRMDITVFIELVKSISGLISTYEIRLRNLPNSLDNPKNKMLARNLFLTTWYSYRLKWKTMIPPSSNKDIEKRLSLFQRFIKRLIESDTPEKDIKSIISTLMNDDDNDDDNGDLERSEKRLCLFLRRVCLAEFFLLKSGHNSISDDQMIDWDEVLLPSKLSTKYEFKFSKIDDNIEFKPFSLMNFPREFLKFGGTPYSLPIEKTDEITFLNLTDYNFLIDRYDEISGEIIIDDETENKKTLMNINKLEGISVGFSLKTFYSPRNYPSIVMLIGKSASQMYLIDQSFFAFLDPIYIDKYGCQDIGYARSQPLFLSDDKLEKLTEEFLSGDFSYFLYDIERIIHP